MSNEIFDLVKIENGQAVTTSLIVAKYFEREHYDVIKIIRNIVAESIDVVNDSGGDFSCANSFVEASYIDKQGKPRPMYYLNRDGFMLLVMYFSGKKALEFKWKFIEAFNAMEQKLKYGSQMPMTYLDALKALVAKEEAYQLEKARADENQEVKELYDTSVAQNNYWIPMKAVADILDCVGVGRTNLYRFLRDEGVLTSKNEPMRQYQENGFMKTSYYSDWLGQYVCVVSFKGLKFIFKKLKNANKIPRSTTFDDWVALCKDMVVQDDKSESILTD